MDYGEIPQHLNYISECLAGREVSWAQGTVRLSPRYRLTCGTARLADLVQPYIELNWGEDNQARKRTTTECDDSCPPPSPLLSYVDIATANILYSHSQSILIRIIQTFIFYKIFAAQKLYIFIHALLVHVDKETLCRYTVELIWSSSSKSLNEAFIWVSSEQIKKRMQILSNIKERLDSFLLTQTSFCFKLSNETFISKWETFLSSPQTVF